MKQCVHSNVTFGKHGEAALNRRSVQEWPSSVRLPWFKSQLSFSSLVLSAALFHLLELCFLLCKTGFKTGNSVSFSTKLGSSYELPLEIVLKNRLANGCKA